MSRFQMTLWPLMVVPDITPDWLPPEDWAEPDWLAGFAHPNMIAKLKWIQEHQSWRSMGSKAAYILGKLERIQAMFESNKRHGRLNHPRIRREILPYLYRLRNLWIETEEIFIKNQDPQRDPFVYQKTFYSEKDFLASIPQGERERCKKAAVTREKERHSMYLLNEDISAVMKELVRRCDPGYLRWVMEHEDQYNSQGLEGPVLKYDHVGWSRDPTVFEQHWEVKFPAKPGELKYSGPSFVKMARAARSVQKPRQTSPGTHKRRLKQMEKVGAYSTGIDQDDIVLEVEPKVYCRSKKVRVESQPAMGRIETGSGLLRSARLRKKERKNS